MKTDPSIERVRKVRHQISSEFDHDPKQLIQYYIQLQKKHQSRIIDSPMQFQHKDIERESQSLR